MYWSDKSGAIFAPFADTDLIKNMRVSHVASSNSATASESKSPEEAPSMWVQDAKAQVAMSVFAQDGSEALGYENCFQAPDGGKRMSAKFRVDTQMRVIEWQFKVPFIRVRVRVRVKG